MLCHFGAGGPDLLSSPEGAPHLPQLADVGVGLTKVILFPHAGRAEALVFRVQSTLECVES